MSTQGEQHSSGTTRPERIGPYHILSQLGEGGLGTVYLAEQTEPVHRRVAVKVIKWGLDTREVVARFEAERQALAVMNHPHVATVYDGGATEQGRPYFVMEYVPGEPITAYCDKHRLTTHARLELFLSVCEAIQHAHQKAIIHRDIKPSNVLVTIRDGQPVPKVIDFGIAKAINQRLTERTVFTEQGQLIGTPEYMSPEQAEMSALDIDTRTDVYSLGVLLYELLVGVLPFDAETLRRAGYAEMQRMIREVEPLRPSARLSTLGRGGDSARPGPEHPDRVAATDAAAGGSAATRPAQAPTFVRDLGAWGRTADTTLAAVAGRRQTEPAALVRQLRGDLDWVVMKALEKDRTRRYGSPADLAADIRRHLHHEPVLAGPPSAAYRLRKFVRRNRVPVTAVGAVLLALVAGFGTAVWQAREAARQRDIALLAQRQETEQRTRADERALAAEKAEKAENERADQLKQVSDFQSQILSQIDVTKAGAELIADVCERFAVAMEEAGVPEAERAAQVDTLRGLLGRVNATDTAAALIDRTILKPAVEMIDKQFKDQPVVDAQLREALACLYLALGLCDAAFPLQDSALTMRRRVLGDEHPDTLTSINNMGTVLYRQGKRSGAEPYYREALEKRRRVLGEQHLDTLTSISYVGILLEAQGKLAEAEAYFREALEKRRRVLGDDHPDTLSSISTMGVLLWSQGKLAEAEPYYGEVLGKSRRVLGEQHSDTLTYINNMGVLLWSQGKLAEAEPYIREALENFRRVLGEEHPWTLTSINNMGLLLDSQGKLAEAEPYIREALEKRRRVLGDEHPDTLISVNNMGSLLKAQGRLSEAEPYTREALEKSRRVLGDEHPHTLASINNMGLLLRAQGNHEEAIALLAPAEAATRKAFTDGDASRLATFLTELGRARVELGYDVERFGAAEANLLEAHPIFVQTRGETHKDTLGCVQDLVDLYTAWHAAEPDQGHDLKAAEWRAKLDQWQASTQPARAPAAEAPGAASAPGQP